MKYVELLNSYAKVVQDMGNSEKAGKVCESSLKICEDNYDGSP